ncbi:MAG TPA: AidA/PixA family protein [Pseudolabrys sp.]|nr:AidA/PixA family protein [Pseudolabrys sp.]
MTGDDAKNADVGFVYVCIAVDVAEVTGLAAKGDDPAAVHSVAASSPAVIATSTAQPSHKGIAVNVPRKLLISARTGDVLRIYAISGSYNFESAALLSDMQPKSASNAPDIVSAFSLVVVEQTPVTPTSEPLAVKDDGDKQQFWFWQATILGGGSQQCHAVLALYDRDDQGRPSFTGLYGWDLALTVKLKKSAD